MQQTISSTMGLAEPPGAFLTWSPIWNNPQGNLINALEERVMRVEPVLVVIDPLRIFWPKAEEKPEHA